MQPGYGQTANDPHKEKRRTAVIIVSCLFLVAIVFVVAVGITTTGRADAGSSSKDDHDDHKPESGEVSASKKAVIAICEPTEFKKTCINALSSINSTDPRELIKTSFNMTIKHIHHAMRRSVTLQELEKDKSGRDALRICREQMEFAIADLRQAFAESEKFDLSKVDKLVEEVKVWLSGALAYQETCLDGFEGTPGKAGEEMRTNLKTSEELTRNALAIVDQLSSVIPTMLPININRRLLEASKDGYPNWLSEDKHRLLAATPANIIPNIVVAKDGTGKYTTINEALKEVPKKNPKPFVIYVKEGIYNEIVTVTSSNVVMIGDGPLKTKVTGRKNFIDGYKTIETATFAAVGHGFVAKDMGFENSAGPEKHQAVALRVNSDRAVIYNCQMDGYQDTLYVHSHRQFFRDCVISGTIDFIFGDAKVIFQNCKMIVRKPLPNQMNAVTAQGRRDAFEPSGIILQGCTIAADPLFFPVRHTIKTFLGRPWKNFSRTIVMNSHMDDFIDPEGWQQWDVTKHHETCYYAEFNNVGPGSDVSKRVKWPGMKTINNDEALKYTAQLYYKDDEWIRQTGVPYNPGMMPTPM
ncbi:pectinesterase [Ranunculus cassubicifolius]